MLLLMFYPYLFKALTGTEIAIVCLVSRALNDYATLLWTYGPMTCSVKDANNELKIFSQQTSFTSYQSNLLTR